jgi:hypothetical protein
MKRTGTYRFGAVADLAGDPELVFEFFAVFSRFEYALKRSGILNKKITWAEADWKSFAKTLRGAFGAVKEEGFKAACQYLKRYPPRRQVRLSSNELGWEDSSRNSGHSDEEYLLRLVATIRNNLFHGGKYPDSDGGPMDDSARNRRLLEAGLVILNQCLEQSPSVQKHFRETS